ncbi:MAG: 50S ribosomal protein L18 [bacterium]
MKDRIKIKNQKRFRRQGRIRSRISGTAECPRLSVFRGLKHIYAQLIDDETGRTLASARDGEIKKPGPKAETALAVGKLLAEKALAKQIKQAVFDRGGRRYHGRVKAIAEGARAGGLKF